MGNRIYIYGEVYFIIRGRKVDGKRELILSYIIPIHTHTHTIYSR